MFSYLENLEVKLVKVNFFLNTYFKNIFYKIFNRKKTPTNFDILSYLSSYLWNLAEETCLDVETKQAELHL